MKEEKINGLEKKGCFGKLQHKSRIAAEYVFDRMGGKHTVTLGIYECEFCGHYHIGHDVKHELVNKKSNKNI